MPLAPPGRTCPIWQVRESYRGIVREGGHAALFRGLRARLIHVISIIWVQLIMYDRIKQWLGLPATGH